MYTAIQEVRADLDLADLAFTAEAIRHMDVQPHMGIAAVVVRPGQRVLDFQAELIDVLAPYVESGGTADSYVRTEAEPDIDDATIEYIENYVPHHSGANYVAHVTVGIAALDDLAVIEAEPFEPLTFAASAISVYQLGNNGTAAKKLWNLD
ncbi:hypothetical protein ACIOWF_20120 [Cellulosimicrobium cellulans]|uniref:hypothetical protein n=1 Tax=Cellulosimicrobium cellulans TaxID=1710 RepID=UPI00380CBC29